mmetsp:Transcript_8083/g.13017  ORF Transcript_8083/g.13017 Transcript_8083/m.13017 type:complete len:261 (+) Transcript_8083:305-1087(+)
MAERQGAGIEQLRTAIDQWVHKTPPVTRCVCIGVSSLFFVGWALGAQAVATVPLFVISYFEVHRIFISQFFESDPFAVFVVVMYFNTQGKKIEEDIGSRKLMLVIMQLSVFTNLVYCAVMVGLSQAVGASYLLVTSCQGLFPTVLACFILYPPNGPIQVMFLPGAFPATAVPYIIIVMSAIFSQAIPFDLLSAVIVGQFYKKIGKGFSFSDLPLPQYSSVPLGEDHSVPDIVQPSEAVDEKPSRKVLLEAAEARLQQQTN